MPESLGHTVDLTNCDREPIHLLGAVQPFGFLLAVSQVDWRIERVSRNVSDWLGARATDLLGRQLDSILIAEAVHAIRGNLQIAVMGDTTARLFGIELVKGLICDLAVHLAGNYIIIECEPVIEEPSFNAAATVRGMMARLRQTDDDRSFHRVAAREMRALTGFDRVMVYRFDEDGSGEVIAESARDGIESYLGLHYPASDIPQQARALYERNWLRIIPDIDAEAVAIEPRLDRQGQPLDLSMSVLRSVSPIHIEYLRNMGVRASMSVSILKDGLWGLFACHHYAAHQVGFGRRTAAELYGQMFSLLRENREREAASAYEMRAQKLHQRLVSVMASEGEQFKSILAHLDDIADLLACDGIGLCMDGRVVVKGRTPDEAQFLRLVEFLSEREITAVHARHEIGAEFPEAREFAARAAGMLVVPLSRPARDYLIFFREEVGRHVNWAGDPSKPVSAGPLGERLTPRKSFELWKETVRGQSLAWQPVDRRIAESLRVSLLEVILRLTDVTAEERRRGQERQDLLVAELNHRLRNILGLIRGVMTQSKDPAHTVESFTSVVGGRIQALARAHDQITADHWGPVSFLALVNAEAAAYLGGNAQRVIVEGPDALILPEAYTTVALVIHEMMTNSAKYGALSDRRGRVEIATGFDRLGRYRIDWSEHGGPPVKAPTRRGFGSTVIERSISHDLKGEARIEFALAGLRAGFIIPASYVRGSPSHTVGTSDSEDEARALPAELPGDILLVEDNLIIALDVEEMLRTLGVTSVRVASGVAEALRLIEEHPPDFALLDVNLGNETSFAIADMLQKLGLPFAFASGYGEQVAYPDEYAQVKRARKPYTGDALLQIFMPEP